MKTLKYGDPTDPSVSIRGVINEKQLRGHLALIETARKEGACELLGGVSNRQVLPPHVFAGVTKDMAIAQDEIFGPIAPPIIKVKEEKEALHVANQAEYGLSPGRLQRREEQRARAVRWRLDLAQIYPRSLGDHPTFRCVLFVLVEVK